MQSPSFLENQTLLAALEFALQQGAFGENSNQKRTAQRLVKEMKSTNSVSGRHQQVMQMLRKGASIEQMMKATSASRRTVFRYLNHFEEAGIEIELSNGKYRIK